MFNLVNTHIYINVFTTTIVLLLKKVYTLYSIEIFNSGLNCSFQKKCFFTTTNFIKLVLHTVYTIIINFKNLMFVEYFMSGFNCSYQRKVFKNTCTDFKYVRSNWDRMGDDIIDQYVGSIDSIIYIIRISESKMVENLSNLLYFLAQIVFTFSKILTKNIYFLPFIVVLFVNVIFIFLMKKQIFIFNKQTDHVKTIWKNIKMSYKVYEQFIKFK